LEQGSHTFRTKFRVAVKEFGDGTPWLALEVSETEFPPMGNSIIGFEFTPGTTYEQAQDFAKMMNERFSEVSLTTFKVVAPGSKSVN
jgi:hypothetical protein